MSRLIVAPEFTSVMGPLIFLAGPIQGTHDWQSGAIGLIRSLTKDVNIASPRRPIETYGKDFPNQLYNEQVDWETYYLRRASRQGAILFWLAWEREHSCKRAYAQTTRFELAEWKKEYTRFEFDIFLAIGIEEGFTGARYIRRQFAQDCPRLTIHETLKETCCEAVRLALKQI